MEYLKYFPKEELMKNWPQDLYTEFQNKYIDAD